MMKTAEVRRWRKLSHPVSFSLSPYPPISSLWMVGSDRSDLLPHKNEVADSKTEKSDGDDRNKIGRNDDEAL
jgi:hypothetical protein